MRFRSERFAQGAIAVYWTVVFYLFYPLDIICDDGAITLRYLDNFRDGFFYCYNPADGPVFGNSGFLHGLLAGGLAWSRLVSPLQAAFVSNGLGAAASGYVLFRLYGAMGIRGFSGVFAWCSTFLLLRFWPVTVWQALETPLHLALILALLLSTLRNEHRAMGVFGALSVISKLDAVPVVVACYGLRLVCLPVEQRTRKALITGLAWIACPMVTWIAFATALFGSPLPQSANAKLHFNTVEHSLWPYGEKFLGAGASGGEWLAFGVLALCCGITLTTLVATLLLKPQRREGVPPLPLDYLPIAASVGMLALYFAYNPRELHDWYFTIPELLLVVQGIVALVRACDLWLGEASPQLAPGAVLAVTALAGALFYSPVIAASFQEQKEVFAPVEWERWQIGRFLRRNSEPDERVWTGHGHIARESKRYVVDYLGLNMPAVTTLDGDLTALENSHPPDWYVSHGLLDEEMVLRNDLELFAAGYDIKKLGFPAWRIYRRQADNTPPTVAREILRERATRTDEEIVFGPFDPPLTGGSLSFGTPLSVLRVQVAYRASTEDPWQRVSLGSFDPNNISLRSREIVLPLDQNISWTHIHLRYEFRGNHIPLPKVLWEPVLIAEAPAP